MPPARRPAAPLVTARPLAAPPAKAPSAPPPRTTAPVSDDADQQRLRQYTGGRRRFSVPLWAYAVVFLVLAVGSVLGTYWYTQVYKPQQRLAAAERARSQRQPEGPPLRTTGFAPALPEKKNIRRPRPDASMEDIIEFVQYAIVKIETSQHGLEPEGLGSGFVIGQRDDCGVIATNYHVVRSALRANVAFNDGTRYAIEGYLAVRPEVDLAILKLNGRPPNMQILELNADELPRQASEVYSIGHPHGHEFRTTRGIVSAVTPTSRLPDDSRAFVVGMLGESVDQMWIAHDAKIAPGNSGGPLLDRQGNVIGVNTWVNSLELGYAIHAQYLAEMIQNLSADVHGLQEFYKPDPQSLPDLDPAELVRQARELIDVLAEVDWLPANAEEQQSLDLLARLLIVVDDEETFEALVDSINAAPWRRDPTVRAINRFAQSRLGVRGGGLMAVGRVIHVSRMRSAIHAWMQLEDSPQLVMVLLPPQSNIELKRPYATLGISTAQTEDAAFQGTPRRATVIVSRLLVPITLADEAADGAPDGA